MGSASAKRSRGEGSLYKRSGSRIWSMSWVDASGKRRTASSRTSDKSTAARILAKRIADAALRRDGVIDPRTDRLATEGRKSLASHVEAYLGHCQRAGHAAKSIDNKVRHLGQLQAFVPTDRLTGLTADALEAYLAQLHGDGRSARTQNLARQIAVAFLSWAVKTQRIDANPLVSVEQRDERRDRRRVRRPLTDDELSRLVRVARSRGREAWYLAAALAGLRKGDLRDLRWTDVDLGAGTITIRNGKARRVDVLPIHPALDAALRKLHASRERGDSERVFPTLVTDLTRRKDFLRAGIAREELVRDERGNTVMTGSGGRRRPLTRIVCEDESGRVVDLHALRTTLGTSLARAGVAPQVAQRVMRHSDYRTTAKHYTVLDLADTANAVATLRVPAQATQEHPAPEAQRNCERIARGSLPDAAAKCDNNETEDHTISAQNPGESRVPIASEGMERRRLERPTSSLQSWHSTN